MKTRSDRRDSPMAKALRVEPFRSDLADEWDAFVDRSRNGTIFHKRRFLLYHPPERFEDASLAFFDENRLVSVVPAAWSEDPTLGRILESHPGASYGGPVFSKSARTHVIDAVVEGIRRHAAEAGAAAIRTRLPPRVFHRPAVEEMDFVLRFQGFRICRTELSMFVRLDAPDDEALLGTMTSQCRRAVRKALKESIEHGESDDLEQFWDVLSDNLERRYELTPTHSLEDLRRLRELFPEDIRLFTAHRDGRILAGTLVFLCNEEAAHTFYLASREEAQHLRPLNLAVYSAMCWLRKRGTQRLNFGVSTPSGRSVNWGLLSFKESFGARGVCRDTYQLVLRDGAPDTRADHC